jgi:hypothetical protein
MAAAERDGVLEDRWHPVFRHSAGRLGSQYLTAIRSENRLLAWKTNKPSRLSLPPKDFGTEGEWIETGPGATLLSFAPAEWVADSGEAVLASFVLGRILVDGAQAPMFALLKLHGATESLERGARLAVHFAGADGAQGSGGPDFWFEPAAASPASGGVR